MRWPCPAYDGRTRNVPRIRTNEQFSWRHRPGFAGRNEPRRKSVVRKTKNISLLWCQRSILCQITSSKIFQRDHVWRALTRRRRAGLRKKGEGAKVTRRVTEWDRGETTVKVSTYKNTTMPHLFNAEKVPTSFAVTAFFAAYTREGSWIIFDAYLGASATWRFIYATLFNPSDLASAHRSLRGRKRFNKNHIGFVASPYRCGWRNTRYVADQ